MLRFYDRNEGEFVSFPELLDWVRSHRRPDGMAAPVLIWGAAGIGKCISAQTRVVVNDLLLPIEEVWARHAGPSVSDGEGEWALPTEELLVPSVDEDGCGALVPRRVTNFYRQRVFEPGRRVLLDDGSEITMTQQHRLLGLGGWTNELQVGDRVAVPSQLPRARAGERLDPDLVTLLAWQIAEGHEHLQPSHRGSCHITQLDVSQLERVRAAAARFGRRSGVELNSMGIYPPADPARAPELVVSSVAYREYLEQRGYVWGRLSAAKSIPEFVLAADDESRALFLREFFAGEAHVNPTVGLVELSSASKEIAEQVAFLLRGFGIWARVKPTVKWATNGKRIRRTYYRLSFGGSSLRRFADQIGIADPAKQAALTKILARTCNSNVEGLPVGDLLLEAQRLTKLPPLRLAADSRSFKIGKGMTREPAAAVLERFRRIEDGSAALAGAAIAPAADHYRSRQLAAYAQTDLVAMGELTAQLARRVEVDAYWATVVEVDDVLLDGWVYDFEVEEAHNYVAAGMITHNTERVRAYAVQNGFKCNIYLPAHDTSGENLSGVREIEGGRTVRRLPAWLPLEEDGPTVLFIDEINRAPQSVQDGLLELVGSGTLAAAGYTLPSHSQIIAAANPADLEHAVHDIDNAMIDRFIHFAPGYDAAAWVAWADNVGEVHPSVVDFAISNPTTVATGEAGFPVALQGRITATPRSLANLGYLLADEIPERLLYVFALGLLGHEHAGAYVSWWYAWQAGARPLRFEQIVKVEYEQILPQWAKDGIAEAMIEATNERIVAALMERFLNDDLALVVGRYLAHIPLNLRERFLDSARRSAASWTPALEIHCARFVQARGEQ